MRTRRAGPLRLTAMARVLAVLLLAVAAVSAFGEKKIRLEHIQVSALSFSCFSHFSCESCRTNNAMTGNFLRRVRDAERQLMLKKKENTTGGENRENDTEQTRNRVVLYALLAVVSLMVGLWRSCTSCAMISSSVVESSKDSSVIPNSVKTERRSPLRCR